MNSSVGSEIVTGFIGEVEGYLPDMSRCLQTLQQDRAHRPSLAELHRITHTIKGAAAMVGLDDLSGIGGVLEQVMENVLEASLVLDDETVTLLGEATRRIDSYCTMQRAGRPNDGQLFQKTLADIEDKLCRSRKNGVGSGELEDSPENHNPEAMFFEESQESGEDDTELEATPKIPENDFGLGEDGADDLFAEDDFEEVSEDADADSLFDEISSSVSLAEDAEETEDELLFQDIDEEEDEDLFGPVSVESSDLIEETPVFAETEAETEQAGSDDIELEAIDPELLECFREETEEHLENIDKCLNNLNARITDSVDLAPDTQKTLHSLRRSVHTLKGAAAVIGIEQIAAWGHDFEDFLDWLHDEAQRLDPPAVAALRDGATLLASLAEEPTRPVEEEKQRITAKFADITAAFSLNFSSDSGTGAENEGEEPVSSLLVDKTEDASDFGKDSTVHLFADDDSEELNEEVKEADSFFDEFPLSVAAENDDADADDGFLFQDAEETEEAAEEDDFFGSVVSSGLPASSEDSENPDDSFDSFDSFDPFAAEISETGQGGPATEAATEAAEAIDSELLECFHEETEEHLENIDDCLNRLAVSITGPAEFTSTTRETLHSLRRSVHTLKGAAAVIGIEQIAAWGHDFEDFLDWLHDEARAVSPSLIALLREGADLLAELAEEPALSVEARKADLVLHFKEIIAGDQKKEKVASSEDQEGEEGADSFFDEVPIAASDDQRDDFSENSADNAFDAALDAAPETAGSSALELGEDIDAELLQCFHEEAEEHLDNIDRQLNHLGMTVSDETELTDLKRDSLHSIRRSVHTLKGAAAVIGIEQIAAWGHDFEDFLDWLHDEARIIRPEVVKAMQEGTDILVRLVEDPKRSLIADRQKIRKKFAHITIDDIGKSSLVTSSVEQETAAPARQRQDRKTATLRVDINRIDQMVGLSGDMVINLSSFEDSMDATAGTMKELDMILQRLKNINSSLEAGYELASIPHLGNPDDARSSGITEDFDPLEMDRYSELNILIRSLSEAVSDLDSIMTQNALDNVAWQQTVERQAMVLKELQNRMIGIRMTPFSTLSSRMHRTVREAERTTGHPARLTIEGESIMMDTRVWDVMADPLMHILRNAVAHGGSSLRKAGREPLSITLQATRKGGQCTLRVADNGKGLNYEAIRVKGMKLYPKDRVNLMSESELGELIFRHGFSSTGSITNIAGRGVGMDVVRDAIDRLNGSIELISEQGRGTEFIMRLPVAVAQLPAILARFGTQIYAVPMHDVASIARVTPEEKQGHEYTFAGETLPLLHPAKVPGFETGVGYIKENLTEDDQALLVVHAGRRRAAILCEQLIGQRDIVFKDLGTHLHNVPCISGVTIMGNGDLIPILQVEEILRKWTSVIERPDERLTARSAEERGPLRVLVVDDSISVRKVVSNFIAQQGWIPVAARNGIEAIEKIREEQPDFVLLDVEMPRMNGFEVLQALQAQPDLRDIPVAMLTSRSADKYQEKARELGARGFMTKPFKADEVISFIRQETGDEQV